MLEQGMPRRTALFESRCAGCGSAENYEFGRIVSLRETDANVLHNL